VRRVFTSYLPSIALGLFLARFLYELDPLRLAFLGDWPGVIALAAVCLLVIAKHPLGTHYALRFTLVPLLLLGIYVFWPEVDLRWALVLLIGSLALVGQAVISHPTRWFDLALAAGVLALYLLTLGTRVGRADTFEFQVVAPQLGIAHPTGYPLFILMGKLCSLLPFGSMAFRVNLLSALCATAAVLVVYRLIVSLTSDRRAAAIAALALAASRVFWSQAVVTEVYTLNALFVAIILALLIRLIHCSPVGGHSEPRGCHSAEHASARRAPASRTAGLVDPEIPHSVRNDTRQIASIYALALIFGLALSHHLTSVILIPPMVIALTLTRLRLPLKVWGLAMALFLIGLTPWLYILVRWPALHNGEAMSMAEWLGWIFGQRFDGALNLSLWSDPTRWGILGRIALDQFGAIGALSAALGLIITIKRAWRIALMTFAACAGYWFYGLVYAVPDVNVFIIPAFVVMAIWIGVALEALARWPIPLITHHSSLVTRHSSLITFYSLLALLPLSLIAANFAAVDQRERDADLEEWGRYVLSLPIPANAAILADSEKIAPLYYLQVTEGLRPDLAILVLGDEALYRQELDRRLGAGQPVYLARFLPNLPYRLRSLGPLVEVSGEPLQIAPAIERAIAADFGGDIRLLGVTERSSTPLHSVQREAGVPYHITLVWQAVSSQRPNYHVRLRLVDGAGTVWWEDRGAHPVSGYYPTGAWAQGEIVPDFHTIDVEPFTPPGTYHLEVGLATPFRADNLRALTRGGADWLTVAQVEVAPQTIEPLARDPGTARQGKCVRIVSGRQVVTSVDVLGDVPPASEAVLRVTALGADSSVLLTLAADDAPSAITTTHVLRAGESRFVFRAPDLNGDYQISLKFAAPARCRWLAPLTTDCALGWLNVAGEAIGSAINFDNQVVLTTSKIDQTSLQPGETLKVDLTWRGLKTWSADYTAFVHLVGPDGKVHGQIDQWPVQGTLPTSSWSAGQVVSDPYAVTLSPDAPRGAYQVEVGWYLLGTLRRLNVLDAAGQPSADKVIIGEFVVP
jgi:hypothetical protein